MILDIAVLAIAITFYCLDRIFITDHFFPADYAFAIYALYRFYYYMTTGKEKANHFSFIANCIILAGPLTYLLTFALSFTPLPLAPEYVFVLILLIVAVVLYNNPGGLFFNKIKVLKEYSVKKEKAKVIEEYSIVLGDDIYIPGSQRTLHTQVVGGTGSGKTRYYFMPAIKQDIDSGAGLFILDIKSNMREKIEMFVSVAVRDYDIYVFNLGEEGSATYNPLANGTAQEIANRVIAALYPSNENSNTYYKSYGEEYLKTLIALLKRKYEIITFKNLYTLTVDHQKLKALCNMYPETAEAKFLTGLIKDDPKIKNNLSGLLTKLSQFANPDWTKQINTIHPDINMGEILTKNKIFLFQANAMKLTSEYKPISILAMLDLQTEISKRFIKKPEKPFFLYLDEFYNIIYPGFADLINKAREADIGITFGHQAIGDLVKDNNKDLANIILGNSRHKIILNLNEVEASDYFSKLFGTNLVLRKVKSHGADGAVSGMTDREDRQFKFEPDMLKTLKMPSYQDDHSEAVVSINTARGRLIEDIYLSPVDYDRLIAGRLQKRPGEQSQYIDNNLDELTDRAENDYQPPAARETVTEPEPDKPKEGTILNDTIKSTPAKKKTGGFTSSRNIRKEVKGA
jgi:hypothetical protein